MRGAAMRRTFTTMVKCTPHGRVYSCPGNMSDSHAPSRSSCSLSPSPVPPELDLASKSAGRPRRSFVWDYFEYDKDEGKSICQIVTGESSEARKCDHSVAGKYPSNLKQHLRRAHLREFKERKRTKSSKLKISKF